MSNVVISMIRTYAALIVGAVVSWLAARGLNLDPSASAGAIAALTGVITAAYYSLARLAESRWPWLGFLLGHTAKPSYHKAGK